MCRQRRAPQILSNRARYNRETEIMAMRNRITGRDGRGQQVSRHAQAWSQEKHDRIARNALHDLFTFYDALEQEIARLRAQAAAFTGEESAMLERMLAVKEHYLSAMQGFGALDAQRQQNALIRLSDSLLDLMTLAHRHKRH